MDLLSLSFIPKNTHDKLEERGSEERESSQKLQEISSNVQHFE